MRKLKSVFAVIMALTMLVPLAGTAVAGKIPGAIYVDDEPIFPTRFDSVEEGWVTPVKNQYPFGNCWAQATMSCLETDAIKNLGYDVVSTDFSEKHLAYWANAENDEFGDYYVHSKFVVYNMLVDDYGDVYSDGEMLRHCIFDFKHYNKEYHFIIGGDREYINTVMVDTENKKVFIIDGKISKYTTVDDLVEVIGYSGEQAPDFQFICLSNENKGKLVTSLFLLVYAEEGYLPYLVNENIDSNPIYSSNNKVYLHDNVSGKEFELGEIIRDGSKTAFKNNYGKNISIPGLYYSKNCYIANSCENGNIKLFFLDDSNRSDVSISEVTAVCQDIILDGFGLDDSGGGIREMAAATLSTFTGIADEKEDYYSKRFDTDSGLILKSAQFLGDIKSIIPNYLKINNIDPSELADTELDELDETLNNHFYGEIKNTINRTKQWILDHGSANLSVFWDTFFANSDNNSFYCISSDLGVNHALCIVGWDDNYSKKEFAFEPETNGAWLVKNSWGSDAGDSGYYWVSYYDRSAEYTGYSAAVNAFLHEHSYTGVLGQGIAYPESGTTFANVYEFTENERISSVGVFTYEGKNVEAHIRIYPFSQKNGAIAYGQKAVADETYIINNPGYHTIDLKKTIIAEKGKKYVVAVTYSYSDSEEIFAIPTELPLNSDLVQNEWFAVYSSLPGESFYTTSNDLTDSSWNDASDICGNFYINLLTKSTEPVTIKIKDYSPDVFIRYHEQYEFSAEVENMPQYTEVHWFKNGNDEVTGMDCVTVNFEKDAEVQAKLVYRDGTVVAESEIVKVKVSSTIIDKILAFFRDLLSSFKNIFEVIIDLINELLNKLPFKK